jgi:ribulose-5-phosphate 4-epimerase/fuculose-1-phosphate aldolase
MTSTSLKFFGKVNLSYRCALTQKCCLGDLRFFNYRCGRYFYDGVEFVPAPTHLTVSHEKIVATKTGLTSAEATELMRKYGPNVIDIPLAPMSDESMFF